MNYPQISVLTPTFNRRKFLPLFIHNLKQQTYPHNKIEVIIDDDGTEPFTDNIQGLQLDLYPMKLIYHRTKKRELLEKKEIILLKYQQVNS